MLHSSRTILIYAYSENSRGIVFMRERIESGSSYSARTGSGKSIVLVSLL